MIPFTGSLIKITYPTVMTLGSRLSLSFVSRSPQRESGEEASLILDIRFTDPRGFFGLEIVIRACFHFPIASESMHASSRIS